MLIDVVYTRMVGVRVDGSPYSMETWRHEAPSIHYVVGPGDPEQHGHDKRPPGTVKFFFVILAAMLWYPRYGRGLIQR